MSNDTVRRTKPLTVRGTVHQPFVEVPLTPEISAATARQREQDEREHRRWVAEERERLSAQGWSDSEIDGHLGVSDAGPAPW